MEATQITVSDKVGTTQVLVDSTARLGCTHHLGTRAALSITPGGAFFVTGARTEPKSVPSGTSSARLQAEGST